MQSKNAVSKPLYYIIRPGPGYSKKNIKSVQINNLIQPFNHISKTIIALDTIPWDKIIGVSKRPQEYLSSKPGLYVETTDGSFIVQGSENPADEVLTSLIYKQLRIPAPSIKIIDHASEIQEDLEINLDRVTFTDLSLNSTLNEILAYNFITLTEQIPGAKISSIASKAWNVFDNMEPLGRERLIYLGMVIACDTFVNNHERLPWDPRINIDNNLTLKADWNEIKDFSDPTVKYAKFYAIDTRPNFQNMEAEQPLAMQFFEKLEKQVAMLFIELKDIMNAKFDLQSKQSSNFKSVEHICHAIQDHALFRVEPMSEFQILLGIAIGYNNICNLTKDWFEESLKKMEKMGTVKEWTSCLGEMNIRFLQESIKIFRKQVTQNKVIIDWVCSITLNQYNISFLIKAEKEVDDIFELNLDIPKNVNKYSPGKVKTKEEVDKNINSKLKSIFGIDIDSSNPEFQESPNQENYEQENGKEEVKKLASLKKEKEPIQKSIFTSKKAPPIPEQNKSINKKIQQIKQDTPKYSKKQEKEEEPEEQEENADEKNIEEPIKDENEDNKSENNEQNEEEKEENVEDEENEENEENNQQEDNS